MHSVADLLPQSEEIHECANRLSENAQCWTSTLNRHQSHSHASARRGTRSRRKTPARRPPQAHEEGVNPTGVRSPRADRGRLCQVVDNLDCLTGLLPTCTGAVGVPRADQTLGR